MERTIERYHDFSYGHRVFGHENKCARLHGHNGRVYFTVAAPSLDSVGRVIDFGELAARLCNWVELNWDHRFLVCDQDPWAEPLQMVDPTVVTIPFNPTAELMAEHLLSIVGPAQLKGTFAQVVKVQLYETRKCSATVYLNSLVTKEELIPGMLNQLIQPSKYEEERTFQQWRQQQQP